MHPGDCCAELRCPSTEQQVRHGTTFHDLNIYNRDGVRSQNAPGQNVKNEAVDRKAQAGLSRQADELNALEEGVVTPGRLELPTRSLGNCCSIHLSYGATSYNLFIFNALVDSIGCFADFRLLLIANLVTNSFPPFDADSAGATSRSTAARLC